MKTHFLPFEGREFPLVEDDDGRFYVPARPICEAIGARWATQANKLYRGDTYRSRSMTIRELDSRDETIVVPVFRLFGFLRSFHNGLAKNSEGQALNDAFQDKFVELVADYVLGRRPDIEEVKTPLDDRDWRFAAIEARLDRLERRVRRGEV